MVRCVLVIEDELNIIEVISFILLCDGWMVYIYVDGVMVNDKICMMFLDLIILDVMLLGKSGYDILCDLCVEDEIVVLLVLMLIVCG